MHNGLKMSYKPALMDAKARGVGWIVRDKTGVAWGCDIRPVKTGSEEPCWDQRNGICIVFGYDSFKFVNSDDTEPVYIPTALAQIAEMERAQKPPTWNERINQMTAEEKADVAVIMSKRCARALEKESCPDLTCWQCFIEFFNSPYTEGETT